MDCCMGAMNSVGFTSQLESGMLPTADHLTYEGVFNELTFQIGPKAELPMDLHIGFCRAQNPHSLTDKTPTNYLALFTKGAKDGQPRDRRNLNAVIILDVSGSMSGALSGRGGKHTRLSLSKEAIKMFLGRMRDTDSFGLVTFNNSATVVIPCQRKADIDTNVLFKMLEKISAGGGTTLSAGFEVGKETLLQYMNSQAKTDLHENRLIMLTDVCDNFGQASEFLQRVSESQVHCTIVGISDEFQSSTCEQLTEVRGFNYFCAVEDDDLKKYLFANFDYTFFPSNYDIEIGLQTSNLACFEVFGTSDKDKISTYNNFTKKGNTSFVVTKTKSSFPSELQVREGQVLTHGGLILLKLIEKEPSDVFEATVTLTYRTSEGDAKEQSYKIKYELPKGEQFYSEECLAQATKAYFFVHEMRSLLQRVNDTEYSNRSNVAKDARKAMEGLRVIAPETKKHQVDKMIAILDQQIVQ